MAVTLKASRLIVNALKRIGVIAGTETPPADIQQDALDRLNAMIDSWAIQRGTIQGTERFAYPLVSGQGGPLNPYLIGSGLQFNQVCPVWIDDAAITQGTGASLTELPLYVAKSPAEYAAIIQKNSQSPIPTTLFYDGPATGKIFLWQVPNATTYGLALYVAVAVTQFANYNTTSYTLYDGLQLAIETNLALHLLPDFPREGYQVDPMLMTLATQSLAYLKRLNLDPGLLQCDPALQSESGGYAPGAPNWMVGP